MEGCDLEASFPFGEAQDVRKTTPKLPETETGSFS